MGSYAVTVFCGSSPGADSAYAQAATALGHGLAQHGMSMVFGGGNVGLMGLTAGAALGAGAHVTGIIPDFLRKREVEFPGLSELIVTDSMHTRKRRLFALADAFAILPGGLGTFDETIEILTWKQLGQHNKPIIRRHGRRRHRARLRPRHRARVVRGATHRGSHFSPAGATAGVTRPAGWHLPRQSMIFLPQTTPGFAHPVIPVATTCQVWGLELPRLRQSRGES